MTSAETNTSEQNCGPVDPSMISPEMRKVYVYISNTLLEEGRRQRQPSTAANRTF